jgi:hypothetical protein
MLCLVCSSFLMSDPRNICFGPLHLPGNSFAIPLLQFPDHRNAPFRADFGKKRSHFPPRHFTVLCRATVCLGGCIAKCIATVRVSLGYAMEVMDIARLA